MPPVGLYLAASGIFSGRCRAGGLSPPAPRGSQRALVGQGAVRCPHSSHSTLAIKGLPSRISMTKARCPPSRLSCKGLGETGTGFCPFPSPCPRTHSRISWGSTFCRVGVTQAPLRRHGPCPPDPCVLSTAGPSRCLSHSRNGLQPSPEG